MKFITKMQISLLLWFYNNFLQRIRAIAVVHKFSRAFKFIYLHWMNHCILKKDANYRSHIY